MKRIHIFLGVLFGAGALSLINVLQRPAPRVFAEAQILETKDNSRADLMLISRGYRLDRIYRSMEGPSSPHSGLRFTNRTKDDMVWLTGIETEVVDASSQGAVSQEFFCHANLTFDAAKGAPKDYNARSQGKQHLDWRLFTLVPGRLSLHLPEGFGIPVPADAALDFFTMSLNQNVKDRTTEVKMRTRLLAVPASDSTAPKKALFRRALYVLQPQSNDANFSPSTKVKRPTHVGEGCADICSVNASAASMMGVQGEGQTVHWLVPPGRHTYRTDITSQLNLPFDTSIHYATFHVHPFAKYFILRDLTVGEVVLYMHSRDWSDRLGVAHVDEVKSKEGISVYRGHRYEVETEYDNTSGLPTDAMGILYLYLLENEFTPSLAKAN